MGLGRGGSRRERCSIRVMTRSRPGPGSGPGPGALGAVTRSREGDACERALVPKGPVASLLFRYKLAVDIGPYTELQDCSTLPVPNRRHKVLAPLQYG